jgi:hypothetical protein
VTVLTLQSTGAFDFVSGLAAVAKARETFKLDWELLLLLATETNVIVYHEGQAHSNHEWQE